MQPERWGIVKELLYSALDVAPNQRRAFLEERCGSDTGLLREVETLVASHESAGEFLEAPPIEPAFDAAGDPILGTRIGPYRVVEEVGHGGMGAVYRGVRADDTYRQEVAIKLIRPGMDNEFIVRRFRHERQILANLGHPNIARLLDGGTTADGLPYFVMEYIRGKPIDEYCNVLKLPTDERLKLFCTVCSAVHFAHEKLIVHRDIKPGNILIDKTGVPKLLDFGIAKLLDPELSSQTIDRTGTLVRMMTPEYASPEQVRGEQVTAASDIYSLGVLLYQLLTGHRPYRLNNKSPHELAQAICEENPARPSTIVGRVEEITRPSGESIRITPRAVAEARGSDPDQLRRALSGDLDTIILMAMRKEPHRRYATARLLADDIQRHLEGRRVMARKDTLGYRASKLMQRHRSPLIAAAVVLVFVAAFNLVWSRLNEGSFRDALMNPKTGVLTSFPGDETQPAFSPDGKRVAFSWGGENNENLDVYVRTLADRRLLRLTTDPAEDNSPVWSPDGQRIAFFRASAKETSIFLSPAENGVHAKLADVYPIRIDATGKHLDWSPDGRYIAVADKTEPDEPFRIVLVDVETGQKTRLTSPPDRFVGDTSPAFSPDGRTLAFIRAPSSGVRDLHLIALRSLREQRLTSDQRSILSQAWTPDGKWLLFSSNRAGSHSLWMISASGGTPERLPGVGENTSDPSLSRDGTRLVYSQFFNDTNIWRFPIDGTRPATVPPRRLIASTQYDSSPQYSPDGKRVVFRSSRSGYNEIWVADAETGAATQLTTFAGSLTGTPRWSPDGNWIAFDSRPYGQPDIFVISSAGGTPRRLTFEPVEDVVPSWSRDGRWIYFASRRSGGWQVWKVSATGEPKTVQVTTNGGFAAFESPDGKYLYYAKGRTEAGLWRLPIGGGQEEPVLDRIAPGFWGYWAIGKNGIYFVEWAELRRNAVLNFFDLSTRRVSRLASLTNPPIPADSAFALSPDERYVLVTQVDQSGSDLLMAELSSIR
jgi:Tol biopolymer transport system component/tRNA A-37 threonylcarbamoyl transferase component Bud32